MRKLYSLIVFFTIVLLGSCAKDEVNPFGYIYGVVVNSNTSEPIQGARVTLTPTGKSTVTGNDGSYEFVDLEAGAYKVTVQAEGYSSTLKNVTVVAGERAIGDVSLSEKPKNSRLEVDKEAIFLTDGTKTDAIKIKNIGKSGDLEWTIINIPEWLSVTPVKGTTGVGKQSSVEISLKSSFTGSDGKELIISAGNESVNVTVTAETGTGGNPGDGDGDESGETGGDYSSATVTSCDSDIEVKITSCKRSGSNVVFKYFVINNKPEDINNFRLDVKFGYGQAIISDDLGNQYTYQNMNIMFANKTPIVNSFDVVLLKETKTNGEITIKNVPENAKNLTIKIPAESYNQYNFLNDYVKFENVPIY